MIYLGVNSGAIGGVAPGVAPLARDGWDALPSVERLALIEATGDELLLDVTESLLLLLSDIEARESDGRRFLPSRVCELLYARVLHMHPTISEYASLRFIIAPFMHSAVETALAATGFCAPQPVGFAHLAMLIQLHLNAHPQLRIDPTLCLDNNGLIFITANLDALTAPRWRDPVFSSREIPMGSLCDFDNMLGAFGELSAVLGPRRVQNPHFLSSARLLKQVAEAADLPPEESGPVLGVFMVDSRLPPPVAHAPITQTAAAADLRDRERLISQGVIAVIKRHAARYFATLPNLGRIVSGAPSDEVWGTVVLLASVFTPHPGVEVNTAGLNLLEFSVRDALDRVDQLSPIEPLSVTQRTAALIAGFEKSQKLAEALPKAPKPHAATVATLGASVSSAGSSAQFCSLTTAFAQEVAVFSSSPSVTGRISLQAPDPGAPGYGLPGYQVLNEAASGLNSVLSHYADDPLASLRVALNLGEVFVHHCLFSSVVIPGKPWTMLAALRPWLARYYSRCILTDDAGVGETDIGWTADPKLVLNVIQGMLTPESMDMQKWIVYPLALARDPTVTLAPALLPFQQFFGCELETTLTLLDRSLSFYGFMRNSRFGLAAQIRAAVAEHNNYPIELREAFRPALIDFIRQLFADASQSIQGFNCAQPGTPFPEPTGLSVEAARKLRLSRDTASNTILFHQSPSQILYRSLQQAQIKVQVAAGIAAAQIAFSRSGQSHFPQPSPTLHASGGGKKRKANMSPAPPGTTTNAVALPVAASTASATAAARPKPARGALLTPGCHAHNVNINGDVLKVTFEARKGNPKTTVTISIAALAAASGAQVQDCCWASMWVFMLSKRSGPYWALAHCPCYGSPGHGALNSGLHSPPVGLTADVAQSFR